MEGARDAVAGAHSGTLLGDVVAAEANGPGIDGKNSGDEGQQGGLSRAVGSDDPQRGSLLDTETDGLRSDDLAETLRQAADFEDRAHGVLCWILPASLSGPPALTTAACMTSNSASEKPIG